MEPFKKKLKDISHLEEIYEIIVNTKTDWNRQIFLALCEKYNLEPYRYKGEKKTTIKLETTMDFMENILWPDYKKFTKIYHKSMEDILKKCIEKILYKE